MYLSYHRASGSKKQASRIKIKKSYRESQVQMVQCCTYLGDSYLVQNNFNKTDTEGEGHLFIYLSNYKVMAHTINNKLSRSTRLT